jgi:hypothetical protein
MKEGILEKKRKMFPEIPLSPEIPLCGDFIRLKYLPLPTGSTEIIGAFKVGLDI